MSEELKIVIKAVTDTAKKNIKEVKDEVEKLGGAGSKSSSGFSAAMSKLGGAAKMAAGVAVAAFTAIIGALTALVNRTKEYREEQARLLSAFQAAGAGAEEAAQAYNGIYRFLGDSDQASEAAAHLAKLTTNEKELAQWTTICQGVYATFGKSLAVENLTEAANETARVGKVTGGLADALNWAGVSEDAFNNSLAACNSTAEREKLIRETLNGIYYDAAQAYEKNNAEIIAQNEAQARLDATTAHLGKVAQPLVTALTNISAALLEALTPAIMYVVNIMTFLINKIAQAVQWVNSLIGAFTGGKAATVSLGGVATSTANSISKAASGANSLGSNIDGAATAAEKLKRATAGFDELNKLSAPTSSSGSGAGIGDVGGGGVVGDIGTGGLVGALDETESKVGNFANAVREKIAALKDIFAPTIGAWSSAFDTIKTAWTNSIDSFKNGLIGFKDGFVNIASYLVTDFVPNVINSFSTNLAPMIGDVFGFIIEEAALNFEFLGGLFDSVSSDIIVPALEYIKTVATGTFEAVGDAWKAKGGEFLSTLKTFTAGIRENINGVYEGIILPIWQKVSAVLDKVWKEGLQPLVQEVTDAALEIGTCIVTMYNKYVKPIVDWVQTYIYPIVVKIVNAIVDKVGAILISISNFTKGAITTLKGIIQFLTGVFTGNWKKAWDGVKNIFKGIFDSLYAVIKVPLNSIIGGVNAVVRGIVTAVNTAIKAINKLSFTVPDWVPGIGGKKFGFNLKELTAPQIPLLAKGGIVDSATLAVIGERGKEAVVPLENNTQWLDMLVEKLSKANSAPTKIVLALDGKELGQATIKSINNITKQTGSLQLVLA